jgi:hypothetical protein
MISMKVCGRGCGRNRFVVPQGLVWPVASPMRGIGSFGIRRPSWGMCPKGPEGSPRLHYNQRPHGRSMCPTGQYGVRVVHYVSKHRR